MYMYLFLSQAAARSGSFWFPAKKERVLHSGKMDVSTKLEFQIPVSGKLPMGIPIDIEVLVHTSMGIAKKKDRRADISRLSERYPKRHSGCPPDISNCFPVPNFPTPFLGETLLGNAFSQGEAPLRKTFPSGKTLLGKTFPKGSFPWGWLPLGRLFPRGRLPNRTCEVLARITMSKRGSVGYRDASILKLLPDFGLEMYSISPCVEFF